MILNHCQPFYLASRLLDEETPIIVFFFCEVLLGFILIFLNCHSMIDDDDTSCEVDVVVDENDVELTETVLLHNTREEAVSGIL